MIITQTMDGDRLIIAPAGSIDTVSTPEFQQAVITGLQKNDKLSIDLKDVTYVSSAGLRAFLLGQRSADAKKADFEILNANEMVMEVFNLSGFNKLLKIK